MRCCLIILCLLLLSVTAASQDKANLKRVDTLKAQAEEQQRALLLAEQRAMVSEQLAFNVLRDLSEAEINALVTANLKRVAAASQMLPRIKNEDAQAHEKRRLEWELEQTLAGNEQRRLLNERARRAAGRNAESNIETTNKAALALGLKTE